MTRSELAARIKAKYPDYADMDDNDLVTRVVAKYPEYGEGLEDAGSSIDTVLSTPRGQGPTVDDEAGVPDTTVPSDLPPDSGAGPLWILANPGLGALSPTFARGQVKGLGQGVFNLGRLAHQLIPMHGQAPGLQPPPSMPDALATEGTAEDLGAFTGRVAPSMLVPGAGWGATLASGALGGAMESGDVEGAARGAALSGVLSGVGRVASPILGKIVEATRQYGPAAVKGALGHMPFLGPMGRGAATAVKKKMGEPLRQAAREAEDVLAARRVAEDIATSEYSAGEFVSPADEVDGILAQRFPPPPNTLPARKAAEMAADELDPTAYADEVEAAIAARGKTPPSDPGASGSGSGSAPVPMGPPPGSQPSPTSSSTGTAPIIPTGKTKLPTTGGGKRADLPPKEMEKVGNIVRPAGTMSLEDAIKALQGATTPQEKGAILRNLAKSERGAALSDATNKALDPEDAAEAAAFLKQAGSLDEALRLIREHPENSVQDVIKLTRAVREAFRRGGK